MNDNDRMNHKEKLVPDGEEGPDITPSWTADDEKQDDGPHDLKPLPLFNKGKTTLKEANPETQKVTLTIGESSKLINAGQKNSQRASDGQPENKPDRFREVMMQTKENLDFSMMVIQKTYEEMRATRERNKALSRDIDELSTLIHDLRQYSTSPSHQFDIASSHSASEAREPTQTEIVENVTIDSITGEQSQPAP